MISLPHWLLVMGTDRNAGKTTLLEEVIRSNSFCSNLIAIKVSPHFHALENDAKILSLTDHYVIVDETKPHTGKDSARMLAAGARRVFYVQVWDSYLEKALAEILNLAGRETPVVCESGWIRNLVHPGVFAIVNRKANRVMKDSIRELKPLADAWFEFDGERFDPPASVIRYDGKEWNVNH